MVQVPVSTKWPIVLPLGVVKLPHLWDKGAMLTYVEGVIKDVAGKRVRCQGIFGEKTNLEVLIPEQLEDDISKHRAEAEKKKQGKRSRR